MDARFYNSEEIDIGRLATDLVNLYLAQGYQAQQIGGKDQILVQLKKGGDFEAIIGMQAALSLTIQRTAGGTLAMIGQQRWIDKAAVGAVGIVALPVLWPLAITAGVGALRQASLGNQVLNMVDGLVRQQSPNVQVGPIPVHLMPQVQQQWAPPPYASTPTYTPPPPRYTPPQPPQPPPAPATLRCSSCNTPYEAGDTFCSGCGRSLAPALQRCPNCQAELKPGASFCQKCGTSTFQTAQPKPQPQSRPAPPTPTYTPPPPPARPPTPVYTPPAQPQQPPAYTPPPVEPYAAPTVAGQPTSQQPTEPYYTPPVTQTPAVPPQPRVTLVPGTSEKESAPPAPPKRPEVQYYIPSSQAQATMPAQPARYPAPTPPQPIQAKPATTPASIAQTPWGMLTFNDGQQVQLSGEHAVVGRYDHDLGGEHPDVDLAKMEGADTVSRIHAALEHIGSTYTLTDLNSTNATRINGNRLEPDKPTPIKDGDTLLFGKVSCTWRKL
ncbi:MAG TPA: FHA domain-containing protein [Ktedonobacteraceae bacterium]|nr:FHA domain-containing protein [Ktedonobacteraceae bacterium]